MARYIDADALYVRADKAHEIAINRLLDTPKTLSDGALNPEYIMGLARVAERAHFKDEIFDAPTADVVKVVRCKDCKHSDHWYKDKRRCFLWHEAGIDVFEDGFCSYGERREE